MMLYDVEVKIDGETNTYPVTPKVIVAFENQFKIGFIQGLSQNQKMEHIYWIGWESSRSAGVVVKPFSQWLDTLQGVRLVSPKGDDQEI